jgi:hypothetical protein
MKKIILSAVVFCSVFFVSGVQAQTKVSFGVKLNGNLTNVKLADIKGSSSSFRPGASIGGFTRISFGEYFALQPELLFNYTEGEIKCGQKKARFDYGGVEVPVYALGQFAVGNGKFFVGAGPHAGYGFSIDSKKAKEADDDTKLKDIIELEHWYMGGSAIAGYEFSFGLFINAGYQLSFDLNSNGKSSNVRTQTISLGAGYRF